MSKYLCEEKATNQRSNTDHPTVKKKRNNSSERFKSVLTFEESRYYKERKIETRALKEKLLSKRATMESSTKNIEKLSDDNYSYWSFSMSCLLASKELWDEVINDSTETPIPTASFQPVRNASEEEAAFAIRQAAHEASTRAYQKWKVKDRKAYNFIGLSLDRANANLVTNVKSGREAWLILRDSHMASTMGNRLRTKKKLMELKLEAGASMRNHLNELNHLFNNLADIGSPYPEDEKVILTLSNVDRLTIDNPSARGRYNRGMSSSDLRHKLEKSNKDQGYYSKSFIIEPVSNKPWVVDSGSTRHMTSEKKAFTSIDLGHRSTVIVANGNDLLATGIGTVEVKVHTSDNSAKVFTLKEVLWVPGLCGNLLSVRKLAMDGYIVKFDLHHVLLEKENTKMMLGSVEGGQYQLIEDAQCMMADTKEELCVHQWHKIMAHRNLKDIKSMTKQGLKIRRCNCSDDCENCLEGKMSRKPFKKAEDVGDVLDCVVSDVCGPIQSETMRGKRYVITFIDVHSRYCDVEFIRRKSEVVSKVIQHIERMKTQFGKKPKIFRSDRGTEYTDKRLQVFLKDESIKFECTVGYCPQQNGIAERKTRTLLEAARTMLSDSGLPKNHWAEAINHANHVTNRIVNQKTGQSPYEVMFGKQPKWNELRAFGCEGFVMFPPTFIKKLDAKSRKMMFVGFDAQSKGYRMSDRINSFVVSREVKFLNVSHPKQSAQSEGNEEKLPVTSYDYNIEKEQTQKETNRHVEPIPPKHDIEDFDQPEVHAHEEISQPIDDSNDDNEEFMSAEEDNNEDETHEPLPTVRQSARKNKGKSHVRFNDYVSYRDDEVFTVIEEESDPKTFFAVMKSKYVNEWKQAMTDELSSIEDNKTWEPCYLPRDRKAIGAKWIFKNIYYSNQKLTKMEKSSGEKLV